jgi:hypothetical protein
MKKTTLKNCCANSQAVGIGLMKKADGQAVGTA